MKAEHRRLIAALSFILFAAPVLATLTYGSTRANLIGAALMLVLAFVLIAIANDPNELEAPKFTWIEATFSLLIPIVVVGWAIQGIPFWSEPRSLSYLAAFLTYLAVSKTLARDGTVVKILAGTKLLVISIVSLYFVVYIYSVNVDSVALLKDSPPVFNHLRHLNYELYFVVVITFFGILSGNRQLLLSSLLFMFVFLAIWSGGRGAMAAILAAVGTLILFSRHLPVWKLGIILVMFTLFSAGLILWSGKQYMLENTASYTVSKNPEQFSQGRTEIWRDSIQRVNDEGPLAVLTGLGPDAFDKYQILPGFKHPHNVLVQIFMEFGLFGLLVFLYLLWRFALMAVHTLRASKKPEHHIAVAVFFGGLVFSLVDGIFHHIGPMAMMVFTVAMIRSVTLQTPADEATATNQTYSVT